MKKGMIGALAALTALTGGVCAQDAAADSAPPAAKKILIAYYSWGGNTRTMAESIQKAVGGDLFEIRPATPYPTGYQACVDQAKKEINEGFMPALAAMPEKLAAYDVVFVGSPNWWGTIAPPVRRFLTDSDLKGKTVVPARGKLHGRGLENVEPHGGGGCPHSEASTTFRPRC